MTAASQSDAPVEPKTEVVTLVWLDLEMTGLNPETDRILEAAALVTDINLNSCGSLEEVVFQTEETLGLMDDWCKKKSW